MSDALVKLVRLRQELAEIRSQLPPDTLENLADLDAEIESTVCHALSQYGAEMLAVLRKGGVFAWVSPNCRTLFGWDPEALKDTTLSSYVHDEDQDETPRVLRNHPPGPALYRFRMANGLYHWVESRAVEPEKSDSYLVVSVRDINAHYMAQQKASEVGILFADELERMAHTDTLTLLPNRRCAEGVLEREISRSRRSDNPVSIGFFDIDRFKAINDTYGHVRGDIVLRSVGQRMATALRPYDFVARWGGDEFLIILPDTDATNAVSAARRVAAHLAADEVEGTGVVTVSGGVAQYRDESPVQLVDRADKALYRAKGRGRNCIETA